MSTASGKIQGTLVEGGTTSSLSGTVAFKGASSSIDLAEGGAIKSHRDEIVAGGNRYLKLDEGPWVNHGSRANDTGLSTLLKAAATDADQGVEPTFRTGLHRIVTLANTVDVPAALGLDTWNWTDLRSSLRVWSDDAGTVRGFGASIVWTQPVIGVATGFTMEIDVPFDASPKVSIAAPKGAWKWILDSGQKIALALPSTWTKIKSEEVAGSTAYSDPKGGGAFLYATNPTDGITLERIVDSVVKNTGVAPGSRYTTSVGGERAIGLLLNVPKNKVFLIEIVAVHGPAGYVLAFYGSQSQQVANEKVNDQIVATIEFVE